MTYFGFLLRFLVIPILALLAIHYLLSLRARTKAGVSASPLPQGEGPGVRVPPLPQGEGPGVRLSPRAVWIGIAIHVFLAVAYTTPWDNYLVATGVWYYNPDLVTGIVLGYVPIEEYTFFVVETLLAGLWWWFLARRISPPKTDFKASLPARLIPFSVLFLAWAVFTFLFFFGDVKWTYLSITLFWALPAIFPQLLFGADILWHHRKLVFWSILVPGSYLSLMDIVALTDTTWSISKEQTTGVLFFGILPLEEVVFFFITNVLITFGMTLLLSEQGRLRLAEWKALLRRRSLITDH